MDKGIGNKLFLGCLSTQSNPHSLILLLLIAVVSSSSNSNTISATTTAATYRQMY